MVSDPRCPDCNGKVSSTATWCMHCGTDFPKAVDADSGRPVQDRADQRADYESSMGSNSDTQTVGLLVAVFGLLTLPFVSPPGLLIYYIVAAVLAGLYTARQPSLSTALTRGALAVAVTPLALWSLSLVLSGPAGLSFGGLVSALAYAIVVSVVGRVLG